MRVVLPFTLALFLTGPISIIGQKISLRLENGAHFNSSYFLPNERIDDLIQKHIRLKDQLALALRVMNRKKILGFEAGVNYSGFQSVASINCGSYRLTGNDKLPIILLNYHQVEIPVRLLVYLKKASIAKKTKVTRRLEPELICSVGLHYARVLSDFNKNYEGTRKTTRGDGSTFVMKYRIDKGPWAYDGGVAAEVGLNVEGMVAKKVRAIFALRLVHGISPMTTYQMNYSYTEGQITGHGSAIIFSKGDSVTFSVGAAYLFSKK